MSFLLISVVNRLGCKSVNVDNTLTYRKIFVLALRFEDLEHFLSSHLGPAYNRIKDCATHSQTARLLQKLPGRGNGS